MSLEKTGIAGEEDLKSLLPPEGEIKKGGVAILECFQKIPCDPCVEACSKGAIKIVGNINEIPQIDFEKCNGCGLCIAQCPGLAIFVVNPEYSPEESLVMLPFEFLPLPKVGETVLALDREGRPVAQGRVVRVLNKKAQDRTPIISIAIPKGLEMVVRNIRLIELSPFNNA